MGFVWDRRKIKMLYSRSMSEMSRRIVGLACGVDLEGTGRGWGGRTRLYAFAVGAVVCVVFAQNPHCIQLDRRINLASATHDSN